ncbi:MAG: hypothetical protein GY714_08135 [Desulfobacterales bacterium]|nr:hypothetical protein [Desulfobacterales bacterium]MCP4160551.1 hypothetical protein [Deltaproteobacteria bacterium]
MQKSFNKLSYLELIIIILIFILSFITFNYFFSVTKTGSYYQSVISALIGILLTVTITALILKKQVKGEELKNQNIEVFKKKVENYENFTKLIVKSLADRRINENEANELRSAIYNLALFSSEKTIEVLSKFIRNHIIADEEDIETGFFTIISQFRKDLKLEE